MGTSGAVVAGVVWLAAALPVVLCYTLRERRRRVAVSTWMFWRDVLQQQPPRRPSPRVRDALSLIWQLAVLTLLAAAWWVVAPLVSGGASGDLILVLDDSASMSARDSDGRSRWSELLVAARRQLQAVRPGRRVAIITTVGPRVACGWTQHVRSARRVLEELQPRQSPGSLAAGLLLAERLAGAGELNRGADSSEARDSQALHRRQPPRVVQISDECPQAPTLDEPDLELTRIRVGEAVENAGITNFQVRRELADLMGYQVLIQLLNASSKAVETRLELRRFDSPPRSASADAVREPDAAVAGELLDVLPVSLPPGSERTLAMTAARAGGGYLQARLLSEDGFPLDNVAWAYLPPRPPLRVLLAGPPNHYLEEALRASPAVQIERWESGTPMPPSDESTLLVFHRELPAVLPEGRLLLVDPRQSTTGLEVGAPLDDALVTESPDDSPLLAHVQLDGMSFSGARQWRAGEGWQQLVACSGGPLLLSQAGSSAARRLALNVDLDGGELPLRTAFPVLIANCLAWLQGGAADPPPGLGTGRRASYPLSGRYRLRPPHQAKLEKPSLEKPSLEKPEPVGKAEPEGVSEASRQLQSDAGRLLVGPLDRTGFWHVEPLVSGQEAGLVVAVNLADPWESDLRPVAASELPGVGSEEAGAVESPEAFPILAAAAGLPLGWWSLLLAAAAVLLTIDWALYQRRWLS